MYFFRKGKLKALDAIDGDDGRRFIKFLIDMGDILSKPDFNIASEIVCAIYSLKSQNVDEARYNKLIQMAGKINQVRKFKQSLAS